MVNNAIGTVEKKIQKALIVVFVWFCSSGISGLLVASVIPLAMLLPFV
jgi:Cu/Ag efflux pump CusA